MNQKRYYWLVLLPVGALFFALTIWSWLKPDTAFSYSERRHLEQRPTFSLNSVLSENSFMEKFEGYTTDQFPLREEFRSLNALFSRYALGQKLSNDIYQVDGYEAALDYPMDEAAIDWALRCFRGISEKFLTNNHVYFSVVPDKGYFLAEENGYPAMDYAAFFDAFREGTANFASYIDLTDALSLADYYKTDTHWRQERLPDVAQTILSAMDAGPGSADYETVLATDRFYGVYSGQAALPVDAEPLYYLRNETLDHLRVSCLDSGQAEPLPLYDLTLATGKDGYEMFLSGSKALLVIENPDAAQERELIVFRDSFGSSLAPLLCEGYSRVTLIDIRYLSPAFLDRWVSFDGADVLFLYSVSVLNTAQEQLLQ